jgi:EAL domain-containing protein (putative c-di-GMP-specific phosphodiesterase class I)
VQGYLLGKPMPQADAERMTEGDVPLRRAGNW